MSNQPYISVKLPPSIRLRPDQWVQVHAEVSERLYPIHLIEIRVKDGRVQVFADEPVELLRWQDHESESWREREGEA